MISEISESHEEKLHQQFIRRTVSRKTLDFPTVLLPTSPKEISKAFYLPLYQAKKQAYAFVRWRQDRWYPGAIASHQCSYKGLSLRAPLMSDGKQIRTIFSVCSCPVLRVLSHDLWITLSYNRLRFIFHLANYFIKTGTGNMASDQSETPLFSCGGTLTDVPLNAGSLSLGSIYTRASWI